jgi:hypothetical protein
MEIMHCKYQRFMIIDDGKLIFSFYSLFGIYSTN